MKEDKLESRIHRKLKSLHGQTIAKEMGGQVAVNQARMLLDILEIEYDSIHGKREEDFTGISIDCVDLSDVIDECESLKE